MSAPRPEDVAYKARLLAIEAGDDPGAPFEAANIELLATLKTMVPAEFERTRAELKSCGVCVGELDKAIGRLLGENIANGEDAAAADPPHWTVEVWPDPVDGAALADEIVDVFTRHIVLPPWGAEAIALWVLHAWAIDAAVHSPLLVFLSPERRCGKTSAIILLMWLTPRSEPASSVTASVIFRFIEICRPTLLIDELDNAIDDNRDLLAVLNGGHVRPMARILRNVGDGVDFRPTRFSAWSPKVLGTIKILPGALADRSIVIPMSRKRAGDVVARVASLDCEQFARLRSQCLRWAQDHIAGLIGADPYLPKALDDRAIDNWRPLKAIADVLGDEWAARCWEAAKALSVDRAEEETTGVALLQALKAMFAEHAEPIVDKQGKPDGSAMHTDSILPLLHDADARWKEYGRAEKPITDRGLARLLKGFRIKPGPVWINSIQKRGYRVADFGDAFTRYCPEGG